MIFDGMIREGCTAMPFAERAEEAEGVVVCTAGGMRFQVLGAAVPACRGREVSDVQERQDSSGLE